MAGTANAAAKTEMIDLTKLSPDQLMQIKQEFEQVSASRMWVLLLLTKLPRGARGTVAQLHANMAHVNNLVLYSARLGDDQHTGLAVHFTRLQSEIRWIERCPRSIPARLGEPSNTRSADQQYVCAGSHKGSE